MGEVKANLAELITLDRRVVKDVFYRLLGVQKGYEASGIQNIAPLTPVELLVDLHLMEEKETVKFAIEAITLCLSEKQVFESAIDKMLGLAKLPKLFMRTVLLTQRKYPRM